MGDTHHHHHCHIRHNHHVYHHPHMDTTLTEDRLSTITTSSTTTTSTTTVTTKHNNVNHHHHYHRHYHHHHHHHHHHHYSPEKSENLTEDRLSSLPDALLTHILSLLSTKDSVRTSVLSKRWKYIFRHVPSLSFHYDKPETSLAFVKFVDGVLHVHNVWSIRSFQLFLNSFIHDFTVYPWICAAIRRNATRIEVDAKLAQPCALPFNLFKSQMLVHLELCGRFVFGITDTVNLPNLKNLRIKLCVFPSGDLAARLFSSCPVLEELTFDSCGTKGIKVMSISVPSLKRLSISCNYSKCEWELNVPNLEYINCEGKTAKWYSISILKSLNKACIHLKDYDDVGDKLSGLVNKFEEVKFLSLSDDSMEALACVSFSPPIFSKLKILKLKVECYQGWSFFPTLLERAPCLELLVIPEPGFSDGDEEFPDIGTLLPKSVPICFSRSLKEVEHYWSEEDLEYEWLGYLVEYAKVLEKLTIFVKSFRHEAPASYLERRSVIRAVLLALPRGSNTCEIVVKEK